MKVLIGCEYSGTVRDAFIKAGHNAVSVDLDPSEKPGPHIQGDIIEHLQSCDRYDLAILHPPCTHMALCGNRWWSGTPEREEAIKWTVDLVIKCLMVCERVCVENPTSVIFSHLKKSTFPNEVQYIQPYKFGHTEQKKTGLALYNLPRLKPTNDVYEEMMKLPKKERERVFYMPPSKNRGKERARFYDGFAEAMADQWGDSK